MHVIKSNLQCPKCVVLYGNIYKLGPIAYMNVFLSMNNHNENPLSFLKCNNKTVFSEIARCNRIILVQNGFSLKNECSILFTVVLNCTVTPFFNFK